MEYRRFGDTYVLRLERGEEVISSLESFCRHEKIALGSVEGLGASDRAVIGLYDVSERVYHKTEFTEPMEITSLLGNISQKDGEVYLHLHVTASRSDYSCIGGHLLTATVNGACELFVEDYGLTGIGRRFDTATGLNLYDF